MTILDWLAQDGIRLAGDIIIPVAAILIPTVIAARVARRQRSDAADDDRKSRRLEAGAHVLRSLARFISVNPQVTDMQGMLAELRGQIAVYRAWITTDDISGDWLALKHGEGMRAWATALQSLGNGPPPSSDSLWDPPRTWAQSTIETFSGWLSGHVSDEVLAEQASQLYSQMNPRPDDGAK